jgi:predicted transcriptional regulator
MGLTAAFSFLVIIATFYLKPQGIVATKKGRNREYHYIWVAKKLFCVCEDELELIRHTLIYLLTLLQTNS